VCPTKEAIAGEVLRDNRPKDLLLFIGAGDIHPSSRAVLDRLRASS